MRTSSLAPWTAVRIGIALAVALVLSSARGQAAEPEGGNLRPDEPAADVVDPIERLARRELLLSQRASEAEVRARSSALAAYRLGRRSQARFLGKPAARGQDARAATAALLVFRRHAQEASALRAELAHTRDDRQALELSRATTRPAGTSGEEAWGALAITRPARGTVVARPGVRRDPATLALHRVNGLEILGRLNHPIQAPRNGTVRRVEPLPQGGYAVVIAHDAGLVSIITGLRRADVAPGDAVSRGQVLGLNGRNLDGAPMVSFELWQSGQAVDLVAAGGPPLPAGAPPR